MLYNLIYFVQNAVYFIIFIFFYSNKFFVSHALKFKYPSRPFKDKARQQNTQCMFYL